MVFAINNFRSIVGLEKEGIGMGIFTVFKEGGFATLHLVSYDGRDCIRKILKEQYLIEQFQRLQREYKILQTLDHPNIIKVFEMDGASYIMEKADCNLEEYVLSNELSSDRIDEIIDGIINGVQALHAPPLKVVHRDLNPRNILMIDGVPKIADLGICKKIDSQTVATLKAEREGLGTFGYMCLAQFNGDEPDFYFDIYALGRILYFIITKKSPPSFGQLPMFNDRKYKTLISLTQQDNPVIIPTIESFIERKKQGTSTTLTVEQALENFRHKFVDIMSLVEIFEESKQKDNFVVLDKYLTGNLNVESGNNRVIEAIAELYNKEFLKYQQRKFWPFGCTESVTKNYFELRSLCTTDVLRQKLLYLAFQASYEKSQLKAMDLFDAHVIEILAECINILQAYRVDEDLIDSFKIRNGF